MTAEMPRPFFETRSSGGWQATKLNRPVQRERIENHAVAVGRACGSSTARSPPGDQQLLANAGIPDTCRLIVTNQWLWERPVCPRVLGREIARRAPGRKPKTEISDAEQLELP